VPIVILMSETDETIRREEIRLKKRGIPFIMIRLADGLPVVLVDPPTMSSIVEERESGKWFAGRFVSCGEDGVWSASYMADSRTHSHREDLTEALAFRFVLGYRVGRAPQTSRYKGYVPRIRGKHRSDDLT